MEIYLREFRKRFEPTGTVNVAVVQNIHNAGDMSIVHLLNDVLVIETSLGTVYGVAVNDGEQALELARNPTLIDRRVVRDLPEGVDVIISITSVRDERATGSDVAWRWL